MLRSDDAGDRGDRRGGRKDLPLVSDGLVATLERRRTRRGGVAALAGDEHMAAETVKGAEGMSDVYEAVFGPQRWVLHEENGRFFWKDTRDTTPLSVAEPSDRSRQTGTGDQDLMAAVREIAQGTNSGDS